MIIEWRGPAAIIAVATTIAWLCQMLVPASLHVEVIGGFIPARVAGEIIVPGALPMWLTPLSATLLHGDLIHLALNMLILLWCGRQVEQALGTPYFLLLYGVGAYAAALGQWVMAPGDTTVMIGASGAISAVIAFYALVFSNQRVRPVGPFSGTFMRVLWLAAAWLGIQLMMAIGFGAGGSLIAIGAHIGGFVAGLVLARPLLRLRYPSP